jgi:phage/plasmid-associated DNA primase
MQQLNMIMLPESVDPYNQIIEHKRMYSPTDTGNAERFLAMYGRNVKFCHQLGQWMIWTGQQWKVDTTGMAKWYAKQVVLNIKHEIAYVKSDKKANHRKWAVQSEADTPNTKNKLGD